MVVNHLKSKNCGGETGGDVDDGDGHGCFNATRTAAAEALRDWVAAHPTDVADDDVLLLGDMNSNAKEDPIDVFVAAGFTDLAASFGATYSFVFDGQWGSLDYALASPSLTGQAKGSADYHINSDEPAVLDYNTNFKSDSQIVSLFAPDEFRTSDHDPVVSGFALESLSIDEAVIVLRRGGGGSVAFSGSAEGKFTACPRLALRIDGFPVVDVQTVRVGRTAICLSLTNRGLLTFDTAERGDRGRADPARRVHARRQHGRVRTDDRRRRPARRAHGTPRRSGLDRRLNHSANTGHSSPGKYRAHSSSVNPRINIDSACSVSSSVSRVKRRMTPPPSS